MDAIAREPIGKGEFRRVFGAGLVGALLLFGVMSWYSAVWVDELCYTDPAVNLSAGRGLISSVWPRQPADRFFASNTPLHPWLLAGGFKVFGVHRAVMQAMNVLWLVLACWIFWLASGRLGLVRTAGGRFAFFLIALLSSGSYYAVGSGRQDAIGILICAVTTLVASIQRRGIRLLALGVCGAVMPWAGLQIAAYAAVVSVLLLVVLRGRNWRSVVALALGVLAGWAGLKGLYAAQGVSDLFAGQATAQGHFSGWRSLADWNVHWGGGMLDPSLLGLLLVAVVLGLAAARHSWRSHAAKRSFLGVVSVGWISVAMLQLGRFPLYYAWMAILPVAACVCAAAESLANRRQSRVVLVAVTVLSLAWLPVWIALASSMAPRRNLAAVEALVSQVVKPGDVAVGDFASYYALLPRAKRFYSEAYVTSPALSEAERRSITVVVVRPLFAPAVLRALGGEWELQSLSLGSPHDPPLPLNCWDYQLQVWRPRLGGSAP
ncbi:MAG: hypothetical protein B9S32_17875 [Verrucomicrobia bacterium Tous-C9LFEB]|nr:MAG: hypothetical protein B9S32_17875 [Verrucomicrobia bacterium Tous-C9LFEB]